MVYEKGLGRNLTPLSTKIENWRENMSKASLRIIEKKIAALEEALETNDFEFISKWHGNRIFAEKDLEELKARLKSEEVR